MQEMTESVCTNNMTVYRSDHTGLTYENNTANTQDPDGDPTKNANGQHTIILTDTRNSQNYRIRKLADGKCWMIDNMQYASGTYYSPINQSTYCTQGYSGEDAYDYGSITGCGYFYTYPSSINLCPTGWRVPRGGTNLNLNSADYNEFAWLNAKMANPSATTPSTATTTYQKWQINADWAGVLAGWWFPGQNYNDRRFGFYWTSTALIKDAYNMEFSASSISHPGNADYTSDDDDAERYAVRCILN
jgi:uncharacterized protein (TIGR02145 family)